MKPAQLVRVISRLPERQPHAEELDAWIVGTPLGASERRWFRSQKQHLTGWLNEYSGPGAYGRTKHDADARAAYQRMQSAPALLWLAEALGENDEVIERAVSAVKNAAPRKASQCAALRRVIPWSRIEELLSNMSAP